MQINESEVSVAPPIIPEPTPPPKEVKLEVQSPEADTSAREVPSVDTRPPPAKKKKPPAEQEAATSTTPTDAPLTESPLASLNKTPTQEWGIEEVIQFIESTDPCLGVHADLFRKHVSLKISCTVA